MAGFLRACFTVLRDKRGDFVSAALVLPLFLFVVFGSIVGFTAWNAKQVVTEAAREGARLAAVGRPEGEVRDRVAAIVNAHLLGSKAVPSKGVVSTQYDLWGLLTKSGGKLYVSGIEVRGATGSVQSALQGLVGRNVGLLGSFREDPPPPGTQNATLVPGSGGPPLVQTNGALRLQASTHNANLWSGEWAAPGGAKIKRIHIKGKSEVNYDYGYVFGWNGSQWVQLVRKCSPSPDAEYDAWVDVSGANVTRLKTGLTTDGSVLYNPTYIDVPEVEVDAPTYAVTYRLPVSLPQRVQAGGTFTVSATVTNNCSFTWPAGNAIGLSYHWYSGSTCVLWDGARSYVTAPVPPGGSYTFQLAVRVGDFSPGTYRLVLDMVHENVTWFAQRGASYLVADVEVCEPDRYFSATHAEEYRSEQWVTANVTTFDKNSDVIVRSDPSRDVVEVEVRYHVPVFFPIAKLTEAFPRAGGVAPSMSAFRGPEILVKSVAKMYREPI